MLKVEDIHTYYGESYILQGVSLNVNKGEIVTLLGRNGAGKTTTLRSIMGLTPPKRGKIEYKGEEITGKKPHEIFHKGIALVPQGRRIFSSLTVLENLKIASSRKGPWNLEKVLDIFPSLKERLGHRGNELSGGEQQMLAIARALMGNPELILLDEPSEGLSPIVLNAIAKVLVKLREEGFTILLVEQNVQMALEIGDRHYIIDQGRVTMEATSKELAKNEEIKRKYLSI